MPVNDALNEVFTIQSMNLSVLSTLEQYLSISILEQNNDNDNNINLLKRLSKKLTPPPVQIEQVVIERRKQEGPNARAAHREARSKTAVVVEIVRDYHNRGHIAQGEAKPRDQTKRHQEDVDWIGERG